MASTKTNIVPGERAEANNFALEERDPEPKESCSSRPAKVETATKEKEERGAENIQKERETKMGKKYYCFSALVTFIAIFLVLIVTYLPVYYVFYLPLDNRPSADIENLRSLLNTSNEQLQLQIFELKEAKHFIQSLQLQLNSSNEQLQFQASELKEAQHFIQSLQMQLNKTIKLQKSLQSDFSTRIQGIEQELNNLFVPSCKDLPQGSPSRFYYILTDSSGVIRVYCDSSVTNCSCDASGGWMRVANLDMTDPTQQCPDGFKLTNRTEPPLRTCGRPAGHRDGCVSTTFPVYGIEYSRVCGRIVGYQFGSPSGFDTLENSIDSDYIAGISLTHGLPRQHIWSFVNAQNELTNFEVCPCIQNNTDSVPLFVGSDYFCDSAVRGSSTTEGIYHPDDPLWDGEGCGSTSTCCEFNNPPWFCKQLPQPTTDDIEFRLCENTDSIHDDSPFEFVQLHIN